VARLVRTARPSPSLVRTDLPNPMGCCNHNALAFLQDGEEAAPCMVPTHRNLRHRGAMTPAQHGHDLRLLCVLAGLRSSAVVRSDAETGTSPESLTTLDTAVSDMFEGRGRQAGMPIISLLRAAGTTVASAEEKSMGQSSRAKSDPRLPLSDIGSCVFNRQPSLCEIQAVSHHVCSG
jgi:hypothetical protein